MQITVGGILSQSPVTQVPPLHLPDIDSISNEQMQALQQLSQRIPLARAAAAEAKALLDDANRAVLAEADALAAAQMSADAAQQRLVKLRKLAAGVAGYRAYAEGLPGPPVLEGLDIDWTETATEALSVMNKKVSCHHLLYRYEIDLHIAASAWCWSLSQIQASDPFTTALKDFCMTEDTLLVLC